MMIILATISAMIAMIAGTIDFYLGGTTFADMLIVNMLGTICFQICSKQGE